MYKKHTNFWLRHRKHHRYEQTNPQAAAWALFTANLVSIMADIEKKKKKKTKERRTLLDVFSVFIFFSQKECSRETNSSADIPSQWNALLNAQVLCLCENF